MGWQPASGILGEEKGGRGGDGKYSVATARREAGSAKRAPGFIGGLYRTFYYNLGDDSFLYVACYTAGPLQPVNVQRGPGLAVGASPRPGKGLRDRAAPSAPTAEEVGEKPYEKVKGKERAESGRQSHPPLRSGVGFAARGQPLRGRVGLQPAEHPSRLRAAATEHSPHSTLCVCNIYVFACIHL